MRSSCSVTTRISVPLLLLLCLALLNGCANPTANTPQGTARTVLLSLGQFPSDQSRYHIFVDFWNENTFLSESDLGLSTPSGRTFDKFSLPSGTTRFGIYLLDPRALTSDPLYFDFYEVPSDGSSFESNYWLDYGGYFRVIPRKLRYGVSEQAGTTLSVLSDLNLDFRKAPYFLYKYVNSNSSLIRASYSSVGDAVWAAFGNSIDDVLSMQKYKSSSSYSKSGTLGPSGALFYLIVEPQEFAVPTSANISFAEINRIKISDTIKCLVPTEKPNVIYAVTTNSHALYQVDPVAKSVTLISQLPLQNVENLVYSATDQKLYGYTVNSGTLLVYDISSKSSKTKVYDPSRIGAGIAIGPKERRIYVCAGESIYNRYLYIINQDTLDNIASAPLIYPNGDIGYSPSEKAILYSQSYAINKYSVANDVIVDSGISYKSTEYSGEHGFVMNHSGSQLVYANISGGYMVRTINTKTMQVDGTWNIGPYPRMSFYSSGDDYIFASKGDGKVYRAQTNDFSQVASFVFPPSNFMVNADGSRIVGFLDSEMSFYFAEISSGAPSSSLSSGSLLALRSGSSTIGPPIDFFPRHKH